ncbi:WD40-repeat-containing domain protein [Glomus cerebriforme]|uniref:WD40-repeat-containing domain protein n=1 Tax=Glomus cerebriforme TaxID=658196 RepID=A0A397SNK5_9GLOM|nr:WD40-repeat-containing domain protein [Glomus cerebriforme]
MAANQQTNNSLNNKNPEPLILTYLAHKGYKQTEAMFRQESTRNYSFDQNDPLTTNFLNYSNYSNYSNYTPYANINPDIYKQSYSVLRTWIEQSLDKFKDELQRVIWPIFVHSYLELVSKGFSEHATDFFNTFHLEHKMHIKELNTMRVIKYPQHVQENEFAKTFRSKKYPIQMSSTSYDILIDFLQSPPNGNNNSFLFRLVNQSLNIEVGSSYTDIGIPSFSTQELEEYNKQEVHLGHMPMDPEYREEVEKTLREQDEIHQRQFEEENQTFSKEADVLAHVETIKDLRLRIELGPSSTLPSICFYTFFNTYDSLNCLTISEDTSLIAGGFSDSYVKIYSLKREKLRGFRGRINPAEIRTASDLENAKERFGSDCKRLLGHSGPVFGLSFSPDNRYLISCSEDRTARLWSTDTYTNLVCYKGHNSPIWDVDFSPLGFYFVTASHDRTARLWSCDHIYPLRIFAGHISDVDAVKFHPNSKYIVTGSSDKSVRMWDIQGGSCLRLFSGHTGGISCISVSEDGRLMASAGEDKSVMLWDLGSGKLLKKMLGHKSTVYSLDFSKESSILVSGGADGTVRLWDVKKGISDNSNEDEYIGKIRMDTDENRSHSSAKQKHITETKDLIKTLPTKQTPVYKIHFTRRNLCLAAGAYMPTEEELKELMSNNEQKNT